MITIKFSDNIKYLYKSFEELLKIDIYNDIIYINCNNNNLLNLPELPNSLKILDCHSNNNLSSLPELPNSLIELYCWNNNLSSLPKLPNSLKYLDCGNNSLSSLPELPNSLKRLYCSNNNLSSLPELPNSKIDICYKYNPIHTYIKKYFNDKHQQYFDYQRQMKRIFANKIGNWYLDCKYNPKYLYRRKRLMEEYDDLYN